MRNPNRSNADGLYECFVRAMQVLIGRTSWLVLDVMEPMSTLEPVVFEVNLKSQYHG